MPTIGGMPGQILGDLKGVVEAAAKQTVKAGSDIAVGTVETVAGAPVSSSKQSGGDQLEKVSTASDPQAQARKKAEEKKRFEEVKSELAQYIERRRQLDAKIAQEKAQQAQVEQQKEAKEKQEKESFAAGLLRRVGSQSHGEVMKSKD